MPTTSTAHGRHSPVTRAGRAPSTASASTTRSTAAAPRSSASTATGSSALVWSDAVRAARAPRPRDRLRPPRLHAQRAPGAATTRTSVAEHADDAAALLDALDGRAGGGRSAAATAPPWRSTSRSAIPTACARWSCSRATRRASSRRRRPTWVDALADRLREVAARARGRRGRRGAHRRGARARAPGARCRRSCGGSSPTTARRSSPRSRASGGWRPTRPRSPRSTSPRCW